MKYFMLVSFLIIQTAFSQAGDSRTKNMRKVAQKSKVIVEDIVYRLEVHDKFHKVLFAKHAGIYYLKNNSKHFTSILSALKSSKEGAEPVKVQADANTLDIEELILSTE